MASYSSGKSQTYIKTYECWCNMKARCSNSWNPQYPDYGGRGITYDPAWEDFAGFHAEMGDQPEGLTLERLNNNLGYFKGNCIWATRQEQAENKRIYKNNKSGVKGVTWDSTRLNWRAEANRKTLYYGRDFFSACCARKSWEVQRG